jgi:hypothetical protein
MPTFVQGRALSAALYRDVVAPTLGPLRHAAALLGWGSDVLGYDTERSTDHGWGPRMQLFVDAGDVADATARVTDALPETFGGWPTHFGWDEVAVRSWVEVGTLRTWIVARLGYWPGASVATLDWLLTSQQHLLEVTGGAVFHDDHGDLTRVRATLAWYPHDIWLWLLACQWQRISQEESFVGRAAEVGDDLGSRIIAARLARDLMRLGFLLERRYAPYGKWLGTAFAALDIAGELGPAIERALTALNHPERERGLVDAYEIVGRRHNALALTTPLDPSARRYHSRPFRVLHAERFVAACLDEIHDPDLRRFPLVGSVDQFVDSTDVLSHAERSRRLRAIFDAAT